ncbi:hypothetical protein EYF80_043648 [Liparis tanakae]|uniref:Uncharacterized protein n=1 Tax=Liparis tanakae TaxID=230148 RepID=A0A4Z2FZT3_9TELE|nr:hypothetical protein EYF80_043648 [Liparis tanakae]
MQSGSSGGGRAIVTSEMRFFNTGQVEECRRPSQETLLQTHECQQCGPVCCFERGCTAAGRNSHFIRK